MFTDRAHALLDPPVVSSGEAAGYSQKPKWRRNLRALLPICSLALPVVTHQSANAAAPLTPFQGSVSVIEGRNIAGTQGARYRLPGGIRVFLSPNAEATIAAQPQMLALTAGKRTPTYSVFLSSGRVDVDIPDTDAGAVAVAGPADVRVIAKRGQVSTLAAAHNMYAFSAKYPLLVSQKERLSTLSPGIVRQFSRVMPPTDHPALEAPQWLAGRQVWLAIPAAAQVSDFAWSPVLGAHSYTVELLRADDGQLLREFTESSTAIAESLPPLTAGNYQLVVRALDELGLPGLQSAPLRLQIVGVEVPPGAKFHPDARIELSQTQTIQLNNADGLSLTRSGERVKRRASEPVGHIQMGNLLQS